MSNYRNGIYVAFAAEGGKNVTETDFRFYNMMTGWDSCKGKEFNMVDSHEKIAIRDGSKETTIEDTLKKRLRNSKLFILLVGDKTRLDDDFVPMEIKYAIDECELPVIVCYVNHKSRITKKLSSNLKQLWPESLKERIENNQVKTLHIPFREYILGHAIEGYSCFNPFPYSMSAFKDFIYEKYYDSNDI